jgi:hypothetical protein
MFAIYQNFEAAQVAVEQCNTAYAPHIKDSVTQRWAEVQQFAEGFGFPLPDTQIWEPDESASIISNPNFDL